MDVVPLATSKSDSSSAGRPTQEAAEFAAMLGRNGHTIEDLRATIGVSDAELKELSEWAEAEPYLASRIHAMVDYHMEVLAEFNALVENDAGSTTPPASRVLYNKLSKTPSSRAAATD